MDWVGHTIYLLQQFFQLIHSNITYFNIIQTKKYFQTTFLFGYFDLFYFDLTVKILKLFILYFITKLA